MRRSQKRLTAQAIEIRSEVRSLRNRLILQRNVIEHYRRTILPLREQIVDLTLKEYNFMLTGAFDLLVAKQQEFEAFQKYLEALRDYWMIRADLQRSLGGRLPDSQTTQNSIQSNQDTATKWPHQDTRMKMSAEK